MRIKNEYLQRTQRMTGLLEGEMSQLGIPGVTMALLHAGEVCYTTALGVKNTAGDPVGEDTLFESASLTKTLFGTLAMTLAGRGIIELDRSIVEVLDDAPWSDDPRFAGITPRHCLSHGCGLPNWQAKPMDMLFDPGSDYSYSGEGYFLLQRMIEQVMGQDLNALLQEVFLQPLGMSHSSATWTPEIGQAFSFGFAADGSVIKIRDKRRTEGNAPEPNAAWSLYSNAFEMIKFLQYMVRERGGLSQSSFLELHTPQNRIGTEIPWGLGWGLCKKDPNVLWHWGDNDGFGSLSLLDWSTGDALSIYSNSDRGAELWAQLAPQLTDATFFDDITEFVRQAE